MLIGLDLDLQVFKTCLSEQPLVKGENRSTGCPNTGFPQPIHKQQHGGWLILGRQRCRSMGQNQNMVKIGKVKQFLPGHQKSR